MKSINRFIRYLGIFLIVVFCGLSIFGSYITQDIPDNAFLKKIVGFTTFFENQFYDLRMRRGFNSEYRDPNIVLVSIDDETLQKIGTWPIPRTHHATLINKLSSMGAKVIAFDVMFPEKSLSCNDQTPDQELAEAIRNFEQKGQKIFLSYTLSDDKNKGLTEVPEKLYDYIMDSKIPPGAAMASKFISKHNFPIQEFTEAGAGLGHIAMREDWDGIFRNYQIVANVDSFYFPSLGLAAFEAFTGQSSKLEVQSDSTGFLYAGKTRLEVNQQGETKIRFIGGVDQYDKISYYDILHAQPENEKLRQRVKDKIIFIGSTATGAHDLRPTAVDAKMPGVYVHMNIAHMLINSYTYQESSETIKWSLYLLLIGSILIIIVQSFNLAWLDLVAIALIFGTSFYFDSSYFMPSGYEIKLFYCWLCFLCIYSWNTFLNFQETSNEKRMIKGAFSRYVAPTVVSEMLKDPSNIKLGGQKRDITCLFSDVRDFTSISEKLSADQLSLALNYYMNEMTQLIFETKGTVDKYIGDAIVAIWGAPLELPDHPQLAVECAIKMAEKMNQVNLDLKSRFDLEFKVGIGINSGECSVGNMGSDRIFSYTALGDNMNLGARLEGLCKYYGSQIIISEYTKNRIGSHIKVRALDRVMVKGKHLPVAIFEVIHSYHPMSQRPELFDWYQRGYDLFLQKKVDEAELVFKKILSQWDSDQATQRLVKLCARYLKEGIPETDHDVTKMTEK